MYVGGYEDYSSGSGFYFIREGADYNSEPNFVQFNPGMICTLFNVSINDDNVLEGNETFDLIIDSSSIPSDVTVGNNGLTTVTILANDGECNIINVLIENKSATLKVRCYSQLIPTHDNK